MRKDARFMEVAKVLGIAEGYTSDAPRQMLLELLLENTALRSRLETISEYEGLLYDADQPIPFQLTEKAKVELDPVSAFEKSLEQAAAAGHGQIVEPANLEDLL